MQGAQRMSKLKRNLSPLHFDRMSLGILRWKIKYRSIYGRPDFSVWPFINYCRNDTLRKHTLHTYDMSFLLEIFFIVYGVLKGSVLSPCLFIFLINSLCWLVFAAVQVRHVACTFFSRFFFTISVVVSLHSWIKKLRQRV